jgi:hypothetical protein
MERLLESRIANNKDTGCFTFQLTPDGLQDMTDGTVWRNYGRRKRYYKWWLIVESLKCNLPRDVIGEIASYLHASCSFKDSFREWNFFDTRLEEILLYGKKYKFNFVLDDIEFSIYSRSENQKDYWFSYKNMCTTNVSVIMKDHYKWTIYDYLLMISEQGSFYLAILGPV